MQKYLQYLHLILFVTISIVLVAFQEKTAGFGLLAVGLATLPLCSREFRKNFLLVYFCLLVLGLTPIGTSTDLPHALYMGIGLGLVVLVPLLVTKKIYKTNLITYPNLTQKAWRKSWTFYLLFAAFVGYLLLPLMLRSDSSYLNWQLQPGLWDLTVAYVGLNFVGIWDELFFILTILAILRNHFPFYIANLAQAVLFTSFLYTLGFGGWCFVVIFVFALAQGLVFRQTKSLVYILAIHLTIDLVLHLALVYLHFPDKFPYFIT
jgi:membrane protease YdiL (CAAX protease family)